MIPDSATVARRRHLITTIVRFLIAAYGAWCLYSLATSTIAQFIQNLLNLSSNPISFVFASLLTGLGYWIPEFALLVLLVLAEPKLVRWIVPAAPPGHLCPKCGYSLKDLKSPICPECGTNLRA